jgi:diguanylate cyclase (GGDEF)-like protein
MESAVLGAAFARAQAPGDDRDQSPLTAVAAVGFGLLGIVLVGYIASLVAHPRGPVWSFVNNWGVIGVEVLASGLCLARALVARPGRWVALALGSGLLAWSLGDIVWTIETQGGGNPETPSLADGFYLAFYPLAYLGVMLLMRTEVKGLRISTWLDGAIAGLGAAAVAAAFAFESILRTVGGAPAELATNLAYPIADLVLLALVMGALAMLPTWRSRRWLILAAGCVVDAVGDTIYLFQSSAGTYRVGTILDATWPTAILLTSLAVWQPAGDSKKSPSETTPRFAVPAIAAACGLGVLLAGSVGHMGRVAIALATATMLAAGMRSVLSLRDLRRLTESHRRQALTDELTGLGNRRHLMSVLEAFFSDGPSAFGNDRGLALLVIDLDHFKEINDSFGHPVGDEVLKMLGPRLQGILRSSDVLTRIGGDEFAVVLTAADLDYAANIAERVTKEIGKPFGLDVATLHVSGSIGIALAPIDASGSAELLRCADVAMYRAKAARCPFERYERTIDEGQNHLRLVEQLRDAIETKALQLYYQPQYDLRTGKIPAVEALVRWPHPDLGVISPEEFIPLAEEAGLMRPLTDLVLDSALAQCGTWQVEGRHISVSVNLSATNLLDAELPDQIQSLLARHGLGPESIVLEVTETTMMADRERSQEVIQRLQDVGLVVSVDDFGTGYSSLAYLSDLAVGELKIDRALTERLISGGDRRSKEIIRATIDLGHSLGLRVVAEGVENAETYELLASLGCDLAQGFFMCRPLPAHQLTFRPMPASVDAKTDHHFALGPIVR